MYSESDSSFEAPPAIKGQSSNTELLMQTVPGHVPSQDTPESLGSLSWQGIKVQIHIRTSWSNDLCSLARALCLLAGHTGAGRTAGLLFYNQGGVDVRTYEAERLKTQNLLKCKRQGNLRAQEKPQLQTDRIMLPHCLHIIAQLQI